MSTLKVDSREAVGARKILQELDGMGIKYSIEKLEVGDYLIMSGEEKDSVLLERKDIFDFAHSIRDHRVWDQLKRMSELQMRIAFVLEGSPAILEKAKRGWNVSSIYGAINSIWYNYNVPVLYTPSKHYTAILIANLCKKIGGEAGHEIRIPKAKKTEDYCEVAVAMLSQIPLVNAVKARRLLERFGSIKNLAENLDKIKEVEGVGEKISEAVEKAFSTNFMKKA
ncbi:MAG: ERCC4 domain-containing protein [Candidatus Bathyarchaeia archaeon]